tara:strand:- start:177 stop:653 length:477 start_codon:yes stop_codon:yes gene_type:complete
MDVQTDFDFDRELIFNELVEAVKRGVAATNIELQARIKVKLSQPGTGKLRKDGKRSSSPGEPPAPQTGDLRRSFTDAGLTRVRSMAKSIEGTVKQGRGLNKTKKYARALEYGYSPNNLKPRPYLRPVVREAKADSLATKLVSFQLEQTAVQLNARFSS